MSDIDTNLNNTEEQPATKNVRLKCDTEGESLPHAPAGKPSSATPSPRGSTPKTSKIKQVNHSELDPFIPENNNEENYALLTQYLLMRDSDEKKSKKQELINKFYFSESSLKQAEDFFQTKNIPFVAKENTTFTFIDLFAGIGGFRLAMQANGGECVFSSEWDKDAKQTYYENYGEVPFGDITKDDVKAFIPEHFDVLCAGFPCQAFSIAGYQKGFDDVRGTLFFDVADIIEKHRPKAFYLENVKNLQSHDNGKTFKKIMDVLENRLGYVVDTKIMNPCEYANIPQNRERIFIIGFDPTQVQIPQENFIDNVFNFSFPEKQPLKKSIHDIIIDSISDEKFFYRDGHIYFERMRDVIINPDTVYQWRRVYIRENKNGVCPTLTANMGEGGHNVPIIKTSKGIRKLTPEECLGFQGFPVDRGFSFPVTIAQSKKYKQAGNSVTEPLIEKVAEKILEIIY